MKYDLVFLSDIIFKTKLSENGRKKLGLLFFEATNLSRTKEKKLDMWIYVERVYTFTKSQSVLKYYECQILNSRYPQVKQVCKIRNNRK